MAASADPIAAAEELAGSTYSSAQDRTTAGKKALLDQLSTQGTYQNEINHAASNLGGAVPAQAPALGDPARQAPATGTEQVGQFNQATLAAATALAAHQQAQRAQGAQTYFDQVSAAVPVEKSRAQSMAQQIMADLIAKREAEAAAKEQAAMQLQIQREQLAGAREARAAAKTLKFSDRQGMEQAALSSALPASLTYTTDPTTGEKKLTPQAEALQMLATDPHVNINSVFSQFGITDPTQQQQVADAANRYQQTLAGYGYYGEGAKSPYVYDYTNPNSQFRGQKDPIPSPKAGKHW